MGRGGSDLRWSSIPSRGEEKYSKLLQATETEISFGSYDPVGFKASLMHTSSCVARPTKSSNLTDKNGQCVLLH